MCDQLSTSVLFCVLQSYTRSYYECRRFNSFCNFSGWGFFIGVLFGYFVKKIIKIVMFVTGGIVGLLLYESLLRRFGMSLVRETLEKS
jgi:uncharacterized membrane protein (Fun14 family)